jgi:hypothetical protein
MTIVTPVTARLLMPRRISITVVIVAVAMGRAIIAITIVITIPIAIATHCDAARQHQADEK